MVRIEYGDFGETRGNVKEITKVSRYQARFRTDMTADQESLLFTDLVVITEDGFVTDGNY